MSELILRAIEEALEDAGCTTEKIHTNMLSNSSLPDCKFAQTGIRIWHDNLMDVIRIENNKIALHKHIELAKWELHTFTLSDPNMDLIIIQCMDRKGSVTTGSQPE